MRSVWQNGKIHRDATLNTSFAAERTALLPPIAPPTPTTQAPSKLQPRCKAQAQGPTAAMAT
eukprot:scaffold6550_cov131-Isochrysis_galbana.AAC.15